MSADDVKARLLEFEASCRERGLRITVQRRVVIEELLSTTRHPTAEDLWNVARKRLGCLSRSTVYRMLELFVDFGLVARVPHPGGSTRYDGDTSPHYHAVCVHCARVYDIFEHPAETVARSKAIPAGFQVEDCEVVFTGTCRLCRRRN